MNIPKNKDETFYADINIFFSTYLPVYIHKVFNFALYQQGVKMCIRDRYNANFWISMRNIHLVWYNPTKHTSYEPDR